MATLQTIYLRLKETVTLNDYAALVKRGIRGKTHYLGCLTRHIFLADETTTLFSKWTPKRAVVDSTHSVVPGMSIAVFQAKRHYRDARVFVNPRTENMQKIFRP